MSAELKALRGSAAIAGAATFGCGEAPGFTDMELLARAARAAVADAGLQMRDIDGLCTASASAAMWTLPVVEYLGLNPRYIDGTMLGGSSFIAHLLPAMQAIRSGQCSAVLICYGSAQRSAAFGRRDRGGAPLSRPAALRAPLRADAAGVGLRAGGVAPHARIRHHARAAGRRGGGRARLGRAQPRGLHARAAHARRRAGRPHGVGPAGRARLLPGHRWRRCLRAGGRRAREDLPRKPVYVLGNATAVWNRQISSMADLTVTAARQSGREAFAMAGLAPADMDVVQLYDAFTINTLLFLEDLGFCPKGEGGRFVADGAIAPGGRLPVNTNGGGLSCVHPGMYGIFALIEAVRQLRGECGEREVKNAQTALAHGNGGMLSSQATAILGTAEALR